MLDANVYTSGMAPGRVYLSGLLFDGPQGVYNTAIAVWFSDDGGKTWSNPPKYVQNKSGPPLLDKPDIVVSWHPGTLGHVYVAYVTYDGTPNGQLFVARWKNKDLNFEQPVPVPMATGNINGAQILVDKYSGYVYVIWTDFGANAIKMSTSTNYGANWSSPETVTSGNLLSGSDADMLNGGVRAPSVPMARYNWIAQKTCIVWHERQFGTNPPKTDVYYRSKSPYGWQQTKTRVNDVTTNDQFLPALDFDTSGNLIVTFYDRRNDGAANMKFHEYMSRIDPNGNRLQPDTRISADPFDPRTYTDKPSFVGDYQDIWDWTYTFGQYYVSVWVGLTKATGYGDIYLSAIQP